MPFCFGHDEAWPSESQSGALTRMARVGLMRWLHHGKWWAEPTLLYSAAGRVIKSTGSNEVVIAGIVLDLGQNIGGDGCDAGVVDRPVGEL